MQAGAAFLWPAFPPLHHSAVHPCSCLYSDLPRPRPRQTFRHTHTDTHMHTVRPSQKMKPGAVEKGRGKSATWACPGDAQSVSSGDGTKGVWRWASGPSGGWPVEGPPGGLVQACRRGGRSTGLRRLKSGRPLLLGLSRSAGLSSLEGQGGLNYWFCCCSGSEAGGCLPAPVPGPTLPQPSRLSHSQEKRGRVPEGPEGARLGPGPS